MDTSHRNAVLTVAGGIAAGLVSAAAAVALFMSSGRDDSHITYWVANSLADGHGIINYNGETVEQSSSLAHVVVLAALRWMSGIDIATIGWIVGVGALIATVALVWAATIRRGIAAAVTAAAFAGLSVPLSYWSVGGLETTLVAAGWVALCVTAGAAHTKRVHWWGPAAAAVLVVTSRPEAVVLLVVGAGALWFLDEVVTRVDPGRERWQRTLLIIGATGVTAGAAQALWRLTRDGSIWPRPGQVKVSGISIDAGIAYASTSFANPAGLALIGAAGAGTLWCVLKRQWNLTWWAAIIWAGASAAIITVGGGDWMEGGRLYAPAVAMAAIPAGLAVGWLTDTRRRLGAAAAVSATAVLAAGLVTMMGTTSLGRPIWNPPQLPGTEESASSHPFAETRSPVHLRDVAFLPHATEVVENALERRRSDTPLTIASGQAGMVAQHLMTEHRGQLEFMDRYGLTGDRFDACARHSPSSTLGREVPWERALSGCAPLPDIIFDIGRYSELPELAEAGYLLEHQQTGKIGGPGSELNVDQFIAVHCSRTLEGCTGRRR